jgi:hypothetical protein
MGGGGGVCNYNLELHMQCDEQKATIKKFINGRTQPNNAFGGGGYAQ